MNLLVAFEALYQERSVTKAGRRLGLSQPATSALLARLRDMLDDELFEPTRSGLEPTARAHALAESVQGALEQLRGAIEHEAAFDPDTSQATFRIGAVDAVLAVLLRDLVHVLTERAPRSRLEVRTIDPRQAPELIASEAIDLAIAPVKEPPAHLMMRELFPVPFVLLSRADHPLPAAPELADLARFPQIVVSFVGPARTPVDAAFEKAGLARRVAVVLSSFLAVPYALSSSDAIAIVPRPFAEAVAHDADFRSARLPPELSLEPLRMRMLWSARTDRAPAWIWLRERIAELTPTKR